MNIFKDFKFTESVQEQIAIGKEIAETYSEANIKQIKSYFDGVKDWEKKCPYSKEDMLYKSIYENWLYGIRPEQQIYFHLLDQPHEVKKTYMGQMDSFVYYARLNKKADMSLFEDKYETYKLLKPYYRREIIKIDSPEDYSKFLDFIGRHPQFVLKPTGLHDTYGVRFVDSTTYSDLHELFNSMFDMGEKYADDYTMMGCAKSGAVMEEIIKQDEAFGIMSPKSLNAVRVPAIRVNGDVHLFGCWMKIGCNDDLIVGESRNDIMVGVDEKTGVFNTDGFFENGDSTEYHPVSKIKIKGFQLPKWDELVAMVKEIGMSMKPTINYISWDLTLTPEGWCIVEGNYYGQSLWQLVQCRGMKKEFEDLIGWHMEEGKYWWQYKIKQVEKEAGLF